MRSEGSLSKYIMVIEWSKDIYYENVSRKNVAKIYMQGNHLYNVYNS